MRSRQKRIQQVRGRQAALIPFDGTFISKVTIMACKCGGQVWGLGVEGETYRVMAQCQNCRAIFVISTRVLTTAPSAHKMAKSTVRSG